MNPKSTNSKGIGFTIFKTVFPKLFLNLNAINAVKIINKPKNNSIENIFNARSKNAGTEISTKKEVPVKAVLSINSDF